METGLTKGALFLYRVSSHSSKDQLQRELNYTRRLTGLNDRLRARRRHRRAARLAKQRRPDTG